MCEKTAVSALKEICEKLKVDYPKYELVAAHQNPVQFVFIVQLLNYNAKGSGRSKSEAKHSASENLIAILKQVDGIKDKIVPIVKSGDTQKNLCAQIDNTVGALLTLCQHRQLQPPVFSEVSATGASHQPEFVHSCKLGSIEFRRHATTKKEAKRLAAKAMLRHLKEIYKENLGVDTSSEDVSSEGTASEAVPWVIPQLELPSVKEVLDEYRRLRKPHIKPVPDAIRYRKNFFLKFPNEKKERAKAILLDDELSSKEIVDWSLKALDIKYAVDPVPSNARCSRFTLVDCDFDCVIYESAHKLHETVVKYLKTMLNTHNVDEVIQFQ